MHWKGLLRVRVQKHTFTLKHDHAKTPPRQNKATRKSMPEAVREGERLRALQREHTFVSSRERRATSRLALGSTARWRKPGEAAASGADQEKNRITVAADRVHPALKSAATRTENASPIKGTCESDKHLSRCKKARPPTPGCTPRAQRFGPLSRFGTLSSHVFTRRCDRACGPDGSA